VSPTGAADAAALHADTTAVGLRHYIRIAIFVFFVFFN
jgi:uncharacterized membrane protein AbrB (regulator of aidB expression)